jgi:hypothetical protein
MSVTTHSGPLVRLPSGRIVGADINDRGNLVPHRWDCICALCEPDMEARRQRVRDAAPDLLEALRDVVTWFASRSGSPTGMSLIAKAERAIAKATNP